MSNHDLSSRISDWVRSHRDEVLETLRGYIAIESINTPPTGGEKGAQMAFAGMARALGCDVDVYEISSVPGLLEHPHYWRERPCTGRPNVNAVRKGKGKGGGRSLLLSGHMDTISIGPDPWSKNPFGGEIDNGKLYGLGAYDMKGGVAASLCVVKALNDLQVDLRGDLLIESVVDEEAGGSNGTLAARLKYNADFAILTEPTNGAVCPGTLGCLIVKVTFRGEPGIVVGTQRPIDPVVGVARFIDFLVSWHEGMDSKWPRPQMYRDIPLPPMRVTQLKAGQTELVFMGERVPSHAWVNVLLSTFPNQQQEEVFDQLRHDFALAQQQDPILAQFEPEWKFVRWLQGSTMDEEHPGIRTLVNAVENVTGDSPSIQGFPAPCDAYMFTLHSPTPVVIFGPTGSGAHAPDEHIEIEPYLQFVEALIRVTIDWCEPA